MFTQSNGSTTQDCTWETLKQLRNKLAKREHKIHIYQGTWENFVLEIQKAGFKLEYGWNGMPMMFGLECVGLPEWGIVVIGDPEDVHKYIQERENIYADLKAPEHPQVFDVGFSGGEFCPSGIGLSESEIRKWAEESRLRLMDKFYYGIEGNKFHF